MKLRTLSLFALPCVALLTLTFTALSAQPPQQDRETTALGKKMREINGILRQLGKGIADESMTQDNAAKILRLQALAVEAKSETPALLAKMADDERAEALVGYRVQMNVLLAGLIELENAVLKHETKDAEKALRALNEAKAEGHGEYKGH